MTWRKACGCSVFRRKQQHAGVEAHNHYDHYASTKVDDTWLQGHEGCSKRHVWSLWVFYCIRILLWQRYRVSVVQNWTLHITVFWILAPLDMFEVSSAIKNWLMSWILKFASWVGYHQHKLVVLSLLVAFIAAGIHCAWWGLRNELLRRVSWRALRAPCCRNTRFQEIH